jgi:Flp pilus assembly pilin Flp
MGWMKTLKCAFLHLDESGQDLTEYGLLAALIALGAIPRTHSLFASVIQRFSAISNILWLRISNYLSPDLIALELGVIFGFVLLAGTAARHCAAAKRKKLTERLASGVLLSKLELMNSSQANLNSSEVEVTRHTEPEIDY